MVRIQLLGAVQIVAGTYPIPSTAIPQGVSMITLDFDVTVARAGDDVQYTYELSFDNGASWVPGPSGIFRGGTPTRLDGLPVSPTLISTETVTLPRPELSTRRVRGTVIVTGATRSMTTGMTLN